MTSADEGRAAIAQWSQMDPAAVAALDPEGDFVKRHLLNPAVLDLLGDLKGRRVLDAGSGQGYFSRMLAARGALVTALESAGSLHEHSVRMERSLRQGVEHRRADLTEVELEPEFDAVVANMVFLSIPDWIPALRSCLQALRPGGRLVFAVEHPCFETAENRWAEAGYLALGDYFRERPMARPVATDHHRTLSTYLNALIEHGCHLERIAEPRLSEELARDTSDGQDRRSPAHVPVLLVVNARRDS